MTTTSRNARIAGFLYLLLAIAGPLRLMYIPTTLFVHGNAAATTSNIVAHQTLFRLGIVSDLFCGTIIIFVTLAFYRLFKDVDQYLAVLVVILGGVLPAAIEFFIVLSGFLSFASLDLLGLLSVNQQQIPRAGYDAERDALFAKCSHDPCCN